VKPGDAAGLNNAWGRGWSFQCWRESPFTVLVRLPLRQWLFQSASVILKRHFFLLFSSDIPKNIAAGGEGKRKGF